MFCFACLIYILFSDGLSGMTNSNYNEMNVLYNKYKDKGKYEFQQTVF